MTVSKRINEIFHNWDKEAFRAMHHPDYMFIREFEMVTVNDHVETLDQAMKDGYDVHTRWTTIHENDYVSELRWEEGNEVVTHVSLLKEGLLWRGFVNRAEKPEAT